MPFIVDAASAWILLANYLIVLSAWTLVTDYLISLATKLADMAASLLPRTTTPGALFVLGAIALMVVFMSDCVHHRLRKWFSHRVIDRNDKVFIAFGLTSLIYLIILRVFEL